MKAAIALIFFACVTGSMAAPHNEMIASIIQQGQATAQAIIGTLQQQILSMVQQAVGQISSLVGSIGGRIDLSGLTGLLDTFPALLQQLANQALGQILGSLSGLMGGM